ncbi:hypothetical protein R1sor_013628 [Riccia sorocarpa]|uniref:Uncharacterized protein n=1 Tax=Riccia sorocarpa TaxID=122646 RepID=A0ABD3HDB7_9MARC
MAESAMATPETKVITLKEAKAWLQSRSAGGCRVVRARLSRIGCRGTATYVGCPICSKSIYARDPCPHEISRPKTSYRLKAYLEDGTGELEATAWEATRCFTRMSLEDYVAKQLRDEESEILDRCIGSTWIVRLGRAENHHGYYARIEYAEAVSRKVLFPCKSPRREVPDAESVPSSPVSTISAFGDGSTPCSTGTSTCEGEYRGEKHKSESLDPSRGSFRRGFEAGFVTCTILVSVGMRTDPSPIIGGRAPEIGPGSGLRNGPVPDNRRPGSGNRTRPRLSERELRFPPRKAEPALRNSELAEGPSQAILGVKPVLEEVIEIEGGIGGGCLSRELEEAPELGIGGFMEEPSSAQTTPGGSQATPRGRRDRDDDPVGPDDLVTVANVHRVVSHEMLYSVFPEEMMVGNNSRSFREMAQMSHIRIMTDFQSVPMLEAVAEGHPVYYREDHARRGTPTVERRQVRVHSGVRKVVLCSRGFAEGG